MPNDLYSDSTILLSFSYMYFLICRMPIDNIILLSEIHIDNIIYFWHPIRTEKVKNS